MKFIIVYGAPCSGKTTYVRNNIKKGDIVFDFDAIKRAFTYSSEHDKTDDSLKTLIGKIRFLFLRFIREDNNFKNVYMIITNLDESFKELVADLNPKYIYINSTLEECLENLKKDDERKDKATEEDLIREYFRKNGGEQRAMKLELRNNKLYVEGYVNAVGRDSRNMSDSLGTKFVEQIVPGAFTRALRNAIYPIKLLLDHDFERNLGETGKNLELYEDNIGLWASAEITEPTIIEKAKNNLLRGWSFGFYPLDVSTEETSTGMIRRLVQELELSEISIIDEKMLPAYEGTSLLTRAEEERELHKRSFFNGSKFKEIKEEIDYSSYEKEIEKFKEEK